MKKTNDSIAKKAQRGGPLDFGCLPVTKSVPHCVPEPAKPVPYVIPLEIQQRMEVLKARAPQLKARFKAEDEFRNLGMHFIPLTPIRCGLELCEWSATDQLLAGHGRQRDRLLQQTIEEHPARA